MADGQLKITGTADLLAIVEQQRRVREETVRMAKAYGLSRREVHSAKRELERIERASKSASRGMRVDLSAITSGISGISPAAGRAASAVMSLGSVGGASMTAMLGPIGLVAAAIAAMGAVSFGAASRMSALVDEAYILAESTGLSIETTQALSHAIDQAGGSAQQARAGLVQFAQKIGDAHAKGGEAAEVFDRLGVSFTDSSGKVRSAELVLRDVLGALDGMSNATERAAARAKIFGGEAARAFSAINPDQLREAEQSTAGLAEEIQGAANSSAEWDEAFSSLSRATTELTIAVGNNLAPTIVGAVESVTYAVDQFNEWEEEISAVTTALMALNPVALATSVALNAESWTDWLVGLDSATAKTKNMRVEFEAFVKAQREASADSGVPFIGDQNADPFAIFRQDDTEQPAQARASSQVAGVDKVAEAYEATQLGMLQLDFDLDRERANLQQDQIERGMAMEEQRLAQEQAAAEERSRIMQQEAQELAALMDLREDMAASAVASAANMIGAVSGSADAIAMAKIVETIAYQTVAVARAFADGGPFVGPFAAATAVATIGTQLAQLSKARQQSHMGSQPLQGSGAPDETTVRVRSGQRVTDSHRRESTPSTVQVVIDNRAYEAMQQRSERQSGLFGGRRRRAARVGV